MPGSPFFGDEVDYSTPNDLVRKKGWPGLSANPATNGNANPLINLSAPTVPSTQPDPNSIPAPDVSAPSPISNPHNLPFLPGYQPPQPQRPPLTTPTGQMVPGLTKSQKLGVLIKSGLMGAMSGEAASEQAVAMSGGHRSGGAGLGFMAGFEQPIQQTMQGQAIQRGGLENQLLQNQVTYAPQMQQLNFAKTMADIEKSLAEGGKATAEGGKATAETGAIPTKTALESAQALAARYKEDSGSGQLIDLQTGQPFGNSSALAPLTQEEAGVLGKQAGERVPVRLKNSANEMVNRGVRSVSANGRQLLVDGQGNTIKDMGQATPLTMIQQQQAPQPVTADMQKAVDMVGKGQMDLPTALSNFRRTPGAAMSFLGALNDQYPSYSQATYGVSKQTMEYFTTGAGGNELNAFRTAITHADLLGQAAQALQNKDTKALNTIKNALKTQFGDAEPTNFNVIANAYTREVTKAVSAGHITNSEVDTQGATMPQNASPKQIFGAVNSYKNLMASKAQQRMMQYEQGLQGKPAFPPGMTSGGGATQGGSANPQGRPVYQGQKLIGYTQDGVHMIPVGAQ